MTWQSGLGGLSSTSIAQAEACVVPQSTDILLSSVTKIGHGTPVQWKGTLHSQITIASDQITLPSGYWYYLEASVQGYFTGSDPSQAAFMQYAWYDSTGTTQLGNIGRVGRQFTGQEASVITADEKSIALIDATSSSVTVELKLLSRSVFNYANYTTAQSIYSNLGRTLIMQLYP